MLKLDDYIIVTEPLLTKRACADIIAATEGVVWRIPDQDYVRTCTTFPISAAVNGGYPAPPERLELIKAADNALLSATLTGLRIYKDKFICVTRSDTGFDILKYEEGQSIGRHVDDLIPRVLTMSIVLNDGFIGGDFLFYWGEKEGQTSISVPMGCAIIFPPTFMYPHEILPIVKGTRYSMITWYI